MEEINFKENLEKGANTPLKLKNDNERFEFLKTYKSWPVVTQINELALRIHKFTLKNDLSIYAFEIWDKFYDCVGFYPFSRNKKYSNLEFRLCYCDYNQTIAFLKKYRKEIS